MTSSLKTELGREAGLCLLHTHPHPQAGTGPGVLLHMHSSSQPAWEGGAGLGHMPARGGDAPVYLVHVQYWEVWLECCTPVGAGIAGHRYPGW